MAYNFKDSLAKVNALKDPSNKAEWLKQREELCGIVTTATSAKHIYVDKSDDISPYLLFVRYDALDKEDYPNGISENSIYIIFEVDMVNKKVNVFRSGHVWLSPYDKTLQKYKYLCMKSIQDVLTDNGGKKFRKQGYKDMKDLAKKMETYYKQVMKEVESYTGGYPYNEGE